MTVLVGADPDDSSVTILRARVAKLEEQRQRYYRRMWRAHEILCGVAPTKARELCDEWEREP